MDWELLKQGAEAKIYVGSFLNRPAILKVRFCKKYRHEDLDRHLTKTRLRSELRGILRCKSIGIRTPTLYLVDEQKSGIYMEKIENVQTADVFIGNLLKGCATGHNDTSNLDCTSKLKRLAHEVGITLGKMHSADLIHGDLTTSNILVDINSDTDKADITMIDFGLSSVERLTEDKGVDLYVLERAILSTHSNIPWFFDIVLESYKVSNVRDGAEVLVKLDEIRLRGRKRTMVG